MKVGRLEGIAPQASDFTSEVPPQNSKILMLLYDAKCEVLRLSFQKWTRRPSTTLYYIDKERGHALYYSPSTLATRVVVAEYGSDREACDYY